MKKSLASHKQDPVKTESYYVYLLLCEDGSYYTGYTTNVASRFERHKCGTGAKYTRMRRPEKIVHIEEFKIRIDAIRRERQIKMLSHKNKGELVSHTLNNASQLFNIKRYQQHCVG